MEKKTKKNFGVLEAIKTPMWFLNNQSVVNGANPAIPIGYWLMAIGFSRE